MYFFLAITQLLKTFNPYFRKHILHTLESHEYLFITPTKKKNETNFL